MMVYMINAGAKKRTGLTALIILLSFCGSMLFGIPLPAATDGPPEEKSPYVLTDPWPVSKTTIEMREKSLSLSLGEGEGTVRGSYTLFNPGEKKARLVLRLPLPPELPPSLVLPASPGSVPPIMAPGPALASGLHPDPAAGEDTAAEDPVKVFLFEEEAPVRFFPKQGYCQWELNFDPLTELNFTVEYKIPLTPDEQGVLSVAYQEKLTHPWAEYGRSSFSMGLKDIHPGQFLDLKPADYYLEESSLVWKWAGTPLPSDITAAIDLRTDTRFWEELLTAEEKSHLDTLTQARDYVEAAEFMEKAAEKADRSDRLIFQGAQAYYLDKAGSPEAERFWDYLYDNKSKIPMVYWALGKLAGKYPSRLDDYYNQAKELQIHPLLVQWLALRLPPKAVRLSAPEKTETSARYNEDSPGIRLSAAFNDKDGDIEKISLSYHWEGEEEQEVVFELQPFQYEHSVSYFIPADHFFTRLYYEFAVTDAAGSVIRPGKQELLYLNKEITDITSYRFWAGNLVLGDFYDSEQDKVYNWFKSYMRLAKEARFINMEFKTPYIIFIGKPHQIRQENPDYYIRYTPEPFIPSAININLEMHRYYLSYLFGSGWSALPEKQLEELGNALMLGKGFSVLLLKYLQDKDDNKFYLMLHSIGQGGSWPHVLEETYGLSLLAARIYALWYHYGNFVVAFFLIITFAWLGKTGLLVRIIQSVRSNK